LFYFALREAVLVTVAVFVACADFDAVLEAVIVRLGVFVAVGVLVAVLDAVNDCVGVRVCEWGDAVRVGDVVIVGVRDREADDVKERVMDADEVAVRVTELVAALDGVGDKLADGVCVDTAVEELVRVAARERVEDDVRAAEIDADADDERDEDALAELDDDSVGAIDGVTAAEAEADGDDDCVALRVAVEEAVRLVVGCGVRDDVTAAVPVAVFDALGEAELDAVCEGEGVKIDEGVGDAVGEGDTPTDGSATGATARERNSVSAHACVRPTATFVTVSNATM